MAERQPLCSPEWMIFSGQSVCGDVGRVFVYRDSPESDDEIFGRDAVRVAGRWREGNGEVAERDIKKLLFIFRPSIPTRSAFNLDSL